VPDAEVSIEIDAPPERVYGLLADLTRMGDWSPETVRCEWVGGATEPRPGARFKGHNRRGVRRWTTTGEIVVAEPGRELAWDVTSVFGLPVARWRYRFEPTAAGGTLATESTEDRRGGLMKILGRVASGVADRETHNAEGMRQTLARLKAAAESS
jgi:uncharacterized protein YndB with AHSA1/START domain